MPRSKRGDAEQPNSLIASAARLTRSRMKRPDNGVQEWQREAWYFYDTVGEYRYGVTWRSNACSRAKLTITEDGPNGVETITEGPEVVALDALFGGEAGQSQMLAHIALHLDVPGETYIVGEIVPAVIDPETGEVLEEVDRWTIYSNEELTKSRNKSAKWKVDRGDGHPRELTDDAVVIRLWDSHPRKWVEANSPTRAVLPILREVEQLTKHVAASTDSRLAGAGILALPSEMTFSAPPADPNDPEKPPPADPFLELLTDAMVTAIQNRDSASAVVPVVVRAPGALIGNIKHITFSTPLDEKALELRKEGIRRLALGLEMPPEVLLGLSDSNHWSAWQIDESALKLHIEPMLETITAGLTERWLQPSVEAMGQKVNPARRINYDTSDLRLRPDRSAEAIQLFDRLQIDGATLRRETGFEEGDEPDVVELRNIIIGKLALAAPTPELVAAALHALGVDVPTPAPEPPRELPAAPSTPPAEPEPAADDREPPDEDAQPEGLRADAAQMAVAELLVFRAIERANNRLNRRSKVRRPIADNQLDAALTDAWANLDGAAEHLGIDVEWFRAALDRYTRGVLREGVEHQPQVLARVLSEARQQRG